MASAGGRSFLEGHAVRPASKMSYEKILEGFDEFARELPPASTDTELDERLTDSADLCYFEGLPASSGTRLKVAVADSDPRFGKRGGATLPRFSRALTAWSRMSPARKRCPLPWLHLVLVCLYLLKFDQKILVSYLLAVFACYLRPGEALRIRADDVIPPTNLFPSVGLRLHPEDRHISSKTGVFDDGMAVDPQYIPDLGQVLLQLARHRGPGNLRFNLSYHEVKAKFQEAMANLNLVDPSLYRLRHGGASHDWAAKLRSLPKIKRRGCWMADSSLRRYEKATRLQAIERSVSERRLRLAAHHAPLLGSYVRGELPLPTHLAL